MMGLDSTTLLLFLVPPLPGFIFNAVKFTRFIGFVAGGGKDPVSVAGAITNK